MKFVDRDIIWNLSSNWNNGVQWKIDEATWSSIKNIISFSSDCIIFFNLYIWIWIIIYSIIFSSLENHTIARKLALNWHPTHGMLDNFAEKTTKLSPIFSKVHFFITMHSNTALIIQIIYYCRRSDCCNETDESLEIRVSWRNIEIHRISRVGEDLLLVLFKFRHSKGHV